VVGLEAVSGPFEGNNSSRKYKDGVAVNTYRHLDCMITLSRNPVLSGCNWEY
jgi:hypothetical protein